MHSDIFCPKYQERVLPDEHGNCSLCGAMLGTVISTYTHQQGVEDGELVEIFKHRWQALSKGKPIVATRHIFTAVSLEGLLEIWNEFVAWRKQKQPILPEEERLFKTTMDGEAVWVIEDAQSYTILYPDDY